MVYSGCSCTRTWPIALVVLVAGTLLPASCSSPVEDVIVSPSGSYSAFLGIQRLPEGYGVWTVNVTAAEDEVLLSETMQDHPASLMAYLAWDDADRLWWYGSDDGSVFYWERSGTEWNRYACSPGDIGGPVPPDSLFAGRTRTRANR